MVKSIKSQNFRLFSKILEITLLRIKSQSSKKSLNINQKFRWTIQILKDQNCKLSNPHKLDNKNGKNGRSIEQNA